MQLSRSNPAGLAIEDRNPLVVGKQYDGIVGPHASTNRGTYTVPAGRKARLDNVTSVAYRVTAAGASGGMSMTPRITPSGLPVVLSLRTLFSLPNVDDSHDEHFPVGVILDEGDVVSMLTEDLSTGGTVQYTTGITFTEFDA